MASVAAMAAGVSGGSVGGRLHIARPRLTDVVAGCRATVVEAPGGFGKTALASEVGERLQVPTVVATLDPTDVDTASLTHRLRRALRRSSLSDLADADNVHSFIDVLCERPSPVALVMDDVHYATSDDAARLLITLATEVPKPHHVLLLGRELPGAARKLRHTHDVSALSTTDLAFTSDEIAQILGLLGIDVASDELIQLMGATNGWPAAVVLAASRLQRHEPLEQLLANRDPVSVVSTLVNLALSELDSDTRDAIVQLAHVRRFSQQVIDAVGVADLLTDVVRSGLPVSLVRDGWWELPGPVEERLRTVAPLHPEVVRLVAPILVETGEPLIGLNLLVATGEFELAASLASIEHEQQALRYDEIAGIVAALPDNVVDLHPRLLFTFAKAAASVYALRTLDETLDRIEALLESAPDRRLSNEVAVRRAYDMMNRHGRWREIEAVLDRVAVDLDDDQIFARLQVLDLRGQIRAFHDDYEQAEILFSAGRELARSVGNPTYESHFAFRIATQVHEKLGDFTRAIDVQHEALSLSTGPRERVLPLSFLAKTYARAGRFAEFESIAEEALETSRRLRSQLGIVYAWQARMMAAANRRDRSDTVRAVEEVERQSGDWIQTTTGTLFFADAADALDRVGEHDRARDYLRRAREHDPDIDSYPIPLYEAYMEARAGDPALAEEKLTPFMGELGAQHWRVRLLRAFAAHRRGEEDAAGPLASAAFDEAASLGHPSLPFVQEGYVAERLVALAAAYGSTSAGEQVRGNAPATVRILGMFDVSRAGVTIEIPAGKPSDLVKIIAAADGRIPVDALIEELWPESDPDWGRKRFRNVLNRVRSAAGDLVVRDGDVIAFAEGTAIDARAFVHEADRVLSSEATKRSAVAAAALARYRGEALPDDRYAPWAATVRERLRVRYLQLLDVLASEAEEAGELDEAIRLVERAIEAERFDEARYIRLGRMFARQGSVTQVRRVAAQATAALAELGLEPSERLRELETA